MIVRVTLNGEHIDYCSVLARRRQESAERNNRRGGNSGPTTGKVALDYHILGVRGECAAYLWLKPIKWHTFYESDVSGRADLGDFIDVKTIKHSGMRLIIQPNSPDEWAYLLVNAGHHPEYAIEGWLWGREAKVERFFRDPVGGRGAFFVPAHELHPPATLKDVIANG